MVNTCQIIKRAVLGTLVVSLVGCTVRPDLVSAHAKKGNDKTEVVEVILSANDAKVIKQREIYFSIVIIDCKNHENRFPIEPSIAGKPASKFNFPITGQFVTAQGVMPERILVDFPKLCVALQGGSYVFGKLDSTIVPLSYSSP